MRKVFGDSGKDGEEMGLEILERTFGGAPAMDVGRNQLVSEAPDGLDVPYVLGVDLGQLEALNHRCIV